MEAERTIINSGIKPKRQCQNCKPQQGTARRTCLGTVTAIKYKSRSRHCHVTTLRKCRDGKRVCVGWGGGKVGAVEGMRRVREQNLHLP